MAKFGAGAKGDLKRGRKPTRYRAIGSVLAKYTQTVEIANDGHQVACLLEKADAPCTRPTATRPELAK
jgi:hypothetical protein